MFTPNACAFHQNLDPESGIIRFKEYGKFDIEHIPNAQAYYINGISSQINRIGKYIDTLWWNLDISCGTYQSE
jgi:hypothetical protein